MKVRNIVVIVLVSLLCVSPLRAMLCLVKHVQRPCVRYSSINTPLVRVYDDVMKIGNAACANAYTTSVECQKKGCVRFAYSCAKNMEMQQRAQRKRDDYMDTLEHRLLFDVDFPYSIEGNMLINYVDKLYSDFHQLCDLEKKAIRFLRHNDETDNLLSYKKTFTLIAHKMRCALRQVQIIKEYNLEDEIIKEIWLGMINARKVAKAYAKEHIPIDLRYLCVNASTWDHPDEIIMYKESAEKE